jgi:hypothetical protein
MHTDQSSVHEPSPFEVESTNVILKWCISPNTDQIPAELVQARSNTLLSEHHKLTNSMWNKEELPQQWKESIIVLNYNTVDKTSYSNYRGISMLPNT